MLNSQKIAQQFSRAARSYHDAAVLQREVQSRLLERLQFAERSPAHILDIGCGPGPALTPLHKAHPKARLVGVDLSLGMLTQASTQRSFWRRLDFDLVNADVTALPFALGSFDLLFSNLCLQWVDDLPRAFAEMARMLKPEGLMVFSTFGPDTLRELRSTFAQIDDGAHVHRFLDMHDVGDRLLAAGFKDPVLDVEHITTLYSQPRDLLRELKALGANNALNDRPRGLMSRARLAQFDRLYPRDAGGKAIATWEVVYAMAFAPVPGSARRDGDRDVVRIPIDQIRRPGRST